MIKASLHITSTANPRIKVLVKLRQRAHRDAIGRMLIEGYREVLKALRNRHPLTELYICPERFQGDNEPALITDATAAGVEVITCAPRVFDKVSYRDRPDGLLAVAPQICSRLDELTPNAPALLLVAEAIEKPGNLGAILRSADGANADGVLVCDRCTDVNNPNVVRASIGTIFSRPVVETDSATALEWLHQKHIQIVASTPAASMLYTEADLTQPCALVLGTEQYGLTPAWLEAASVQVRIPMLGQSDSLNVATAATLLAYEAVRQRGLR